MAKTAIDLIQEMVRGRTELNASMSERTTMRVGGPADILVCPADREDLAEFLGFVRERQLPYFLLGSGSNVIVRDGGIRGAVTSLKEGFGKLERFEDAPVLRAEAGVSLRRLVRWTVDEAISGFEPLSGIPGCVGGALAMNAGAWGREIGELVVEMEVMDPSGRIEAVPSNRLHFSYRHLELPAGSVILSALFRGERASSDDVRARVQDYLSRRSKSQPIREASAGSVFRNPPEQAAGRLIEGCGLKGVRVGKAEVSRVHANFIVNLGGATAREVLKLMEMIQERVYVKHRIRLEPEVIVVGDWETNKLQIRE